MTTQLTKSVLGLAFGDVFYKGEIKFTVKDTPEVLRPMLVGDDVVNVDCVAVLLDGGRGLVGWDHFPAADTVCMVSPSQHQAMQKNK